MFPKKQANFQSDETAESVDVLLTVGLEAGDDALASRVSSNGTLAGVAGAEARGGHPSHLHLQVSKCHKFLFVFTIYYQFFLWGMDSELIHLHHPMQR